MAINSHGTYINTGGGATDPVLDEIKAIKTDFARYGPNMTITEQQRAVDKLHAAQQRGMRAVASSAIDDLDRAAGRFKRQRSLLDEYIRSEAAGWDPVRFSAELGISSVLLDMALKGAEPAQGVKNLLAEAGRSGDRYKIRAIVETIPGALAKTGNNLDTQLKINNVLTTGRDKLKEIRNTPEIEKQRQAVHAAYSEFRAVRDQFLQISRDMGEDAEHGTGAFAPAFDRWQPYMRDGVPDLNDRSEK